MSVYHPALAVLHEKERKIGMTEITPLPHSSPKQSTEPSPCYTLYPISYLVWLSFRLKEVRNGILVFPTLLFFCTSLLKVRLCNKYNSSASTFRSSDLVTMALSKLFSKIAWAISLSEILPPNWIKREGKISLAVAICASVTPNTIATHP